LGMNGDRTHSVAATLSSILYFGKVQVKKNRCAPFAWSFTHSEGIKSELPEPRKSTAVFRTKKPQQHHSKTRQFSFIRARLPSFDNLNKIASQRRKFLRIEKFNPTTAPALRRKHCPRLHSRPPFCCLRR
jgi:hypothetical protein